MTTSFDGGRRLLLLGAGAAGLGACSVLKAPEPVQLFRFGASAGPGASAAAAPSVTVLYTGTVFTRAAAGDRILTSTGVEISYIGGSRWATPAINLFEEGVLRAFQGSSVRLVARGAASRGDATLRIEVRNFEARYSAPDTAPTVVVAARALLTPVAAGAVTSDATFAAELPAADNRVSAIAAAFDAATADVLGRIVGWTAGGVRPAAPV
jgi:cholesterol transport system auxiliary component